MTKKIIGFLRNNYQIALAVIIGFLIAQIQIFLNFQPTSEIKAAFVEGSFTLLSALTVIVAAYLSFKATYVPFEVKQERILSIIKETVKSVKTTKDNCLRIDADTNYKKVLMLKNICDVDMLFFDKESIEAVPKEHVALVIRIREKFIYLRSNLDYINGFIDDIALYNDSHAQTLTNIQSTSCGIIDLLHERVTRELP